MNLRHQINVKSHLSALNCVELIFTQFSILEMCDCVCLCVCVCGVCVCGVCVMCVCVSAFVCVFVILLVFAIKCKKNVWCVLYTHTHPLPLTHSRLHTLAHLHVCTHTHISHPKRVDMRRLLFYTI